MSLKIRSKIRYVFPSHFAGQDQACAKKTAASASSLECLWQHPTGGDEGRTEGPNKRPNSIALGPARVGRVSGGFDGRLRCSPPAQSTNSRARCSPVLPQRPAGQSGAPSTHRRIDAWAVILSSALWPWPGPDLAREGLRCPPLRVHNQSTITCTSVPGFNYLFVRLLSFSCSGSQKPPSLSPLKSPHSKSPSITAQGHPPATPPCTTPHRICMPPTVTRDGDVFLCVHYILVYNSTPYECTKYLFCSRWSEYVVQGPNTSPPRRLPRRLPLRHFGLHPVTDSSAQGERRFRGCQPTRRAQGQAASHCAAQS